MAKTKVLFQLSQLDVIECIRELDLPYIVDVETTVTDEFLEEVKKGLEWGLECWSDVMKVAVREALEKHKSQLVQPCLIKERR